MENKEPSKLEKAANLWGLIFIGSLFIATSPAVYLNLKYKPAEPNYVEKKPNWYYISDNYFIKFNKNYISDNYTVKQSTSIDDEGWNMSEMTNPLNPLSPISVYRGMTFK